MPRGWFASLPGNCRVISAPLGIDEQDFLHLREELGEQCTKKLLIAHNLLCGGKQPKAPCEPDWICNGTLPLKECGLPGRPCVCEDWNIDEAIRRRPCLVKGDWPLAGSFACGQCLQKVFDRYEHKYLDHLVENDTRLNEKQLARLEVLKSAMERHCRETEKSLLKKYEREGKAAVQDVQMKDLFHHDKRVSDPKIMAQRAKDQRDRQEGKMTRSGNSSRAREKGRYDVDTRKRMTTIALLCIKHLGHASISRDCMIKLTDVLIRRCWNTNLLPETIKKKIGGLDNHNNYPLRFFRIDVYNWIDFFTFQQEGAPRTYYFNPSVQTISNETVAILPDTEARKIARKLRASRQAKAKMAGSLEKPFPLLCDHLLELLFDPSKEVEVKQTAEQLKWW